MFLTKDYGRMCHCIEFVLQFIHVEDVTERHYRISYVLRNIFNPVPSIHVRNNMGRPSSSANSS
ncbi:hypothetical protein Fmac_002790 [Flemingia macrophylla]|uniref:Uncharacterized protein n=1 Tax=Flemingia macrophylla TaxID=520843 RepID=A0ABD1NKY9_9FABA